MTKHRNMVFDFTQCYPRSGENGFVWNDCSAIPSSRLYCSPKAEATLKEMIRPCGVSGIHFIDSGDYHYITKLMTDFIKEPFSLVLIDHHTDMQKAALGDLLSCGNWARRVLEENEYLNSITLIGQEQNTLEQLSVEHADKLIDISDEDLKTGHAQEKLEKMNPVIPVYISIDKDVLDEKYAVTNWDQGQMSLPLLEQILKYLITKFEIIGIDICGEYPEESNLPEYIYAERVNEQSDEELYLFIKKCFARSEKKNRK